jgi:uncharacterized protein (TIGR03435 family)
MMRTLAGLAICAMLSQGQTFDVASVKLTPQSARGSRQVHGGPGSTDPGAVTFTNVDLFGLVTMAYGINTYQLIGPAWLRTTRCDINAKLPPGTTVPQYRAMLQTLLAERFKLAIHREPKEVDGFDLVVAKGGPKLTRSPDDPSASPDDGSLQPPVSAPQPPTGYTGELSLRLSKSSMDHFAAFLAGVLGQPVHNTTGLDGAYDIHLVYTLAGLQPEVAPGENGAATPLDALQQQLGLKLARKKETIERVVVDHMEKAPTQN